MRMTPCHSRSVRLWENKGSTSQNQRDNLSPATMAHQAKTLTIQGLGPGACFKNHSLPDQESRSVDMAQRT